MYLKLEYLNPTGSFKDRGAATAISEALSRRCSLVVEDSSGNAGISYSATAFYTNSATPSIILEVNGTKISSLNAFTSLLSEFYNHSLIIELKVEKCIVEGYKAVRTGIIDNYAMYKPAGSKLGVYLRELISSTTPDHVITTLTYLNWIFVVSFSLALINAAPLFITDGGRIVSEMLSRVSMKVNYLVQAVTSVAIVILLLIGLVSYI